MNGVTSMCRYWLSDERGGRLVLLGDHTHVVKDGGRMPGVVSFIGTAITAFSPQSLLVANSPG
jgi:hypothetical protein